MKLFDVTVELSKDIVFVVTLEAKSFDNARVAFRKYGTGLKIVGVEENV